MATVSLSNFTKTVEKILDQYKEDVSAAVEPGLDEAEKYLIQELKSASPKDTGDYASHWQESSRGKGYRAIKNDKKVEWKSILNSDLKSYRYYFFEIPPKKK